MRGESRFFFSVAEFLQIQRNKKKTKKKTTNKQESIGPTYLYPFPEIFGNGFLPHILVFARKVPKYDLGRQLFTRRVNVECHMGLHLLLLSWLHAFQRVSEQHKKRKTNEGEREKGGKEEEGRRKAQKKSEKGKSRKKLLGMSFTQTTKNKSPFFWGGTFSPLQQPLFVSPWHPPTPLF